MTTTRSFTGYFLPELGLGAEPNVGETFDISAAAPININIQDNDGDEQIESSTTNTSPDANQTAFFSYQGADFLDGVPIYLESSFTFTVGGQSFTGYYFEVEGSSEDFLILPPNVPAGTATINSVNTTPGAVNVAELASGDEVIDQNNHGSQDLSGADTLIGGGGDDTIDAGAGDDSVFGGDGDDSILGNAGADTLDGGDGNDTIRGDEGDEAFTASRESFNWSQIPDPNGGDPIDNGDDISGGTTQDTGTVDVTLTYTGLERADVFQYRNNVAQNVDDIDGGGETVSTTSVGYLQGVGGGTPGETASVTFDFASNTANVEDEVRNVQFRVNDVDDQAWRDVVFVQAFNAAGQAIPVTLTGGADMVITDTDGVLGGDTAEAIQNSGNGQPSQADNSLLVEVAGPVSQIIVTYGNLETDVQRVDITDVFFDAVTINPNVATGDDVIDGGLGADMLFGGGGDDTVFGGDGADVIEGGDGADSIEGGGEADIIDSGDGADMVFGGDGGDVITFGAGADTVFGGAGGDFIDEAPGNSGFNDNNLLDGGEGDDTIFADAGADTVIGGGGQDVLFGEDGDDSLQGDGEADQLFGGEGQDTLEGGDGSDNLFGGAGNDDLRGEDGDDTLDGGAGDDNVEGGDGGDDLLLGSTGSDTLGGGAGDDTVSFRDEDGATTLSDETVDVSVDDDGDGSATKEADGGTDTIIDVQNFVADEGQVGTSGVDEITLTTTVVDRSTIQNIDPGVTGTFTPDNGNAPIAFGGVGQPTFNELLAEINQGRFTIVSGDEDGQIGNISFQNFETINFNVVCFTTGAMIRTDQGERAVETLKAGDLVETLDKGLQPIRWVGRRRFARETLEAQAKLRPIVIAAGALGNTRELRVSPQHRMLLKDWRAALMFGADEVLVKAADLVNGDTIYAAPAGDVEYFHILFDDHEIVFAEGAPSESFHPGAEALETLDPACREEVLALFPELADGDAGDLARQSLKTFEARAFFS